MTTPAAPRCASCLDDGFAQAFGCGIMSGTARHSRAMRSLTRLLDCTERGLVVKTTHVCSIEDCPDPVKSHGYCRKHYLRWYRHGDPNIVLRIVGDHEARFWSKVNKDGPLPESRPDLGSCWLWTGNRGSKDYGAFQVGRRSVPAHRFAYELLVGVIPDGLVLDHLCRVHPCVNPAHLEPVTDRVNIMRGVGSPAKNGAKTACSRNHPFDEVNTYWYADGRRDCRKCMQIRDRRRRERARRAAA